MCNKCDWPMNQLTDWLNKNKQNIKPYNFHKNPNYNREKRDLQMRELRKWGHIFPGLWVSGLDLGALLSNPPQKRSNSAFCLKIPWGRQDLVGEEVRGGLEWANNGINGLWEVFISKNDCILLCPFTHNLLFVEWQDTERTQNSRENPGLS